MAKSVCVCCGNDATGLRIEEDYVIKAIRSIKLKLNIKPKNNVLVWCRQCYPRHFHVAPNAAVGDEKKKDYPTVTIKEGWHGTEVLERPGYEQRRKNYESRQAMYVGIGVVFAILGLIISPGFSTLGAAILLIVFLYLLSLLNYTPKVAAARGAK